MSTATAAKSETPAAAEPERRPVRIDPTRVTQLEHESLAYMIRMPADATMQDLNDPAVFRRVQGNSGVSLRRLDRLTIVAFDETWIAECFVASATATGVSISKPRITTLEPRDQGLFQDALYKVAWDGRGYTVVRKSDGAPMTLSVANETLAVRDLKALYPATVRR